MRSRSRIFLTIIYILIMISPALSDIFDILGKISNPFDYARITDIEYTAVLVDEPDSNGKVIITEKLTYDIHAASEDNLFWELWRELPEDTIDGLKVDYTVNSVKQVLEDGTEVIYDESSKLYWYDSDYISSVYGPRKMVS